MAADFPLKPAYQSDLSISHRSLGEIYGITGRFDKAEAAYNRSLTIAAKLACEDQHIAEYQRALAGYHNAMALLHHDKGALGKAETAYKASLTTWKKLADKHPEVPIYQQNLALSHNNLALLYNGEGQFKKAEAAHQMSLDILIKLANRHPNVPEYQENLANSHNSLGNVFSDTRRYDKAEAAYNRALTIQDKLSARHPEVPKYQETLAGIQNNLGNLCRRTGQFDEAEEAHQASLSIRKKLADQHPDVPEYQRWQYNAASNFVWMVARYPGRSEKDYAEALRLAEMCVEQRPKESDSWQVLGWARYRNGQWQPAIDALETSIELQKNKGDAWQWIFLSMAHWQLGNQAEAHKWYVKSIARRTKSKNEEWLRFLAEADELLGMPVVVGHTDVVESVVFLPDGAGPIVGQQRQDDQAVGRRRPKVPGHTHRAHRQGRVDCRLARRQDARRRRRRDQAVGSRHATGGDVSADHKQPRRGESQ